MTVLGQRWTAVRSFVEQCCHDNRLNAAAIAAGRSDETVGPFYFGRHSLAGTQPLSQDAVFLVASITKPIVGTAALILIERGLLGLGDRVAEHLPGFGRHGKHGVTIRHLLTHTSGLPDMLPDNVELRQRHAPLSAFVDGTMECELAFPPGRGVQYQSMGFAILAAVIESVTGRACRDFVRDEVFAPLGMTSTALGAPEAWFDGAEPIAEQIAEIRVPDEQAAADWNWNSRYWRTLGAPWGGLLTTPHDLTRFAQMMLRGGATTQGRLLSSATVAAATRNQLSAMPELPEVDQRCRPWGLGWRLQWPSYSANFGDLLGPASYGHWGATGTVLWIDPERDLFGIVLTTQPQEPHGVLLSRICNLLVAALV